MTSTAKPEWKPVQTPGMNKRFVGTKATVQVRKDWTCDACGKTIPKGSLCKKTEYCGVYALRFHEGCVGSEIWVEQIHCNRRCVENKAGICQKRM